MTANGWEMEADPRHAELLIQQLELETSKGVISPGTEQDDDNDDDEEIEDKEDITRFRGAAARANYIWPRIDQTSPLQQRRSAETWQSQRRGAGGR